MKFTKIERQIANQLIESATSIGNPHIVDAEAECEMLAAEMDRQAEQIHRLIEAHAEDVVRVRRRNRVIWLLCVAVAIVIAVAVLR